MAAVAAPSGRGAEAERSRMNPSAAQQSATLQQQQQRQIPIVCPGHTRPLAELQFCSVDNPVEQRCLLVSACHDRIPMLRDGTTGDWIGSFVGHKGAVWSAKLDPTGNLAATASGDFSVKVWDAITGSQLYHFPHEHIVKSCDFSPDSRSLATGGKEAVLRVYDLVAEDPSRQSPRKIQHLDETGKTVAITKVVWKSDSCLITGGDDGKIRIWTVPREVGGGSAPSPKSPSHVLSTDDAAEIRDAEYTVTARGEEILTVASGSKVYFFDLVSFVRLHAHPMPVDFREEGGASLHPTESKFIAGGSDLWVRVFDYATGKELECLKGHHGPVRCLRYAPDGKSFATGSEDGTIRLWKSSE